MSDVARLRLLFLVRVLAATALLFGVGSAGAGAQEHPGKATYDRWCAECHGVEGRGDGPAAARMLPRPRDFTQARYQIRTTASGALPTDADMMRVLDEGMPGTAMPAWPKLTRRDKTQLIEYLKTFSRFFESEGTPEPLDAGRAPRASADAIAEGRQLYDQLECWKCHGRAGRGDGTSAPTQTDDNGYPIRPADLTQNWRFNGGGDAAEIHMRLLTGLDGTPMPSFTDLLEANVITPAQLWNIAHYVRSLSPEDPPEAREIVRAVLRSSDLPTTPDDETWTDVPAAYIPLVGQIIEPPRWFAPTVTAVWVQAVHNGEELVLRLVWNDPSRSPDPAWADWRRLVVDVMEPKEEPAPGEGLPDAFAVQFPAGAGAGRDLPYFLMGDARAPVHLWQWHSDGSIRELTARGLDRLEVGPQPAAVTGTAVFEDGQWRLLLRRALAPDGERPEFRAGEPIPIAFYAWDGSNGESGKRVAIGSWYYLFLEQPVTAAVYLVPIGVVVLTALLGIAVVRLAQRAPAETDTAPAQAEPGPPFHTAPAEP